MYNANKAAEMAAYLLFKAGADGLSPRRLLALMYLAERESIRHRSMLIAGDSFILTEHGPVMKQTSKLMMDAKHKGEWALRMEWHAPQGETAMVAEADVAYAARRPSAPEAAVLALRSPQPPPRWMDDGTPMDTPPEEWPGKDEGMPYFLTFSKNIRTMLDTAWQHHGGRDEDDLIQHMLELPECGDAVSGELPLKTILQALGYPPSEVKNKLAFVKELDSIDRLWDSISSGS